MEELDIRVELLEGDKERLRSTLFGDTMDLFAFDANEVALSDTGIDQISEDVGEARKVANFASSDNATARRTPLQGHWILHKQAKIGLEG